MSRPRNRRGEGEQLREALLSAAADLMEASGDADALSVRAVTAAAGVSPTALYMHFESITDLVHAIKKRCFAALGDALRGAAQPHEGDPVAALRAMGHAYLRYAREHPGHYAMLFHSARTRDAGPAQPPDPEIQRAGLEVFLLLVTAVAACTGDQAGDQAAYDAACVLWTGLHGRAHISKAMPWFSLPAESEHIEMLVRAALGHTPYPVR